jgi:serine/threonine protein phosphatase PrpC
VKIMATPPSKRLLSTSEHLYRIFLFVYPAEFRRACRQEMVQTFRDCCREAQQRAGAWGLMRFWGFILYDLLITAFVEHARASITLFKRLLNLDKEYHMLDHLLSLDVALHTDIGLKRANNEDSMTSVVPRDSQVMATKGALFVVADGMGGHEKGEVASALVVNTVSETYYRDDEEDIAAALVQAVKRANDRVYQEAAEKGDTEGKMGSTCIAAVLQGESAYVANVGDSRAYIVRQGQAKQISRDHSWVAEQILAGALTPEEARTHEKRNVITRCVGVHDDVEVDTFTEQVRDGDVLVLCTDGLSALVDEDEMCAIVEQYGPQESVSQLIARANERGGPDNITAVVARVSLA